METAIKLAIEGGYIRKNGSFSLPMKLNDEFDIWEYDINSILLDPLFWQALGKACGWEVASGSNMNHQWALEWHNFISHLIKGKDPNSFFEELLK